MNARDMTELRRLLRGVMRNEEVRERRSQNRVAMCRGKVRLNTFADAQRVAKKQARAHDGCAFQPYACQVCGGYHVGEKIRSANKRPMKEITHG